MRLKILNPSLAAALALGLVGPLAASEDHDHTLPDEIEWGEGPDFIEPGAELAVLRPEQDPRRNGQPRCVQRPGAASSFRG